MSASQRRRGGDFIMLPRSWILDTDDQYSEAVNWILVKLLALADYRTGEIRGVSFRELARQWRMRERTLRERIHRLELGGDVAIVPAANQYGGIIRMLRYRERVGGAPESPGAAVGATPGATVGAAVGAAESAAADTLSPAETGPLDFKTSRLQDTRQEQELAARSAARVSLVDFIFEGLCQACGMDPHELTNRERDKVNAAVRQLVDRGLLPASPEARGQILDRASRWLGVMGSATMTPNGIVSNWARLNGIPRGRDDRAVEIFREALETERREDAEHQERHPQGEIFRILRELTKRPGGWSEVAPHELLSLEFDQIRLLDLLREATTAPPIFSPVEWLRERAATNGHELPRAAIDMGGEMDEAAT